MFTKLYLSFKKIDNLNEKFSKHSIYKLLPEMQVFLMVVLMWSLIANQATYTGSSYNSQITSTESILVITSEISHYYIFK